MQEQQPDRAELTRKHFLGWQCRIRQISIRDHAGRPSPGMRPDVSASGHDLGAITVLINKAEPEEITAQFRYMVKKTLDPAERYDAVIKLLAAAYYQKSHEFSDLLTGLFGPGSGLATHLIGQGRCELRFTQFSQTYALPCSVSLLEQSDPSYQATFWHNSLFNPEIPAGVMVLGFQPDWDDAHADPKVPGT
tara:strand:- start:956 stop:1531 length:576 start_codon:yes stop_codon:yes gene_type:complete